MKELMNDIKTGTFRRVYLLHGPENYLKYLWRGKLVKALIPEDNSMNLSIFSGKDISEGAVIDQAETLPFFSDRRVIRLDNTELFDRAASQLPDYMKSLPEYLTMIFTEEKVDRRSRMFKAVQKYGLCAEFSVQSEAVLSKWILQMLTAAGLRIRKSDMDFLLLKTGTDMTHISLEVDKLIHYCMGSEEVTREAIELIVTDRIENRIFDMIAAITGSRTKEAMKLYADLCELREPPLRILFLIAKEYNRLHMVKELDREGLGPSQIASAAGMPPFAVKKSLGLIRGVSSGDLLSAVRFCTELEEDIKNGRMKDEYAVEMAIHTLSRRSGSR